MARSTRSVGWFTPFVAQQPLRFALRAYLKLGGRCTVTSTVGQKMEAAARAAEAALNEADAIADDIQGVSGKLALRYWPALGRSTSISIMLADSGQEYDRENHDGSKVAAGVFAVPAVRIHGQWISQTMGCMMALGDEFGCMPPKRTHNKYYTALLNAYDAQSEAFDNRMKLKTAAEAQGFFSERIGNFLKTIEENYTEYRGPYWHGETPCSVDYVVASFVILTRHMYGKEFVDGVMAEKSPTAAAAAQQVLARPNVKAWIDGGYGGYNITPPDYQLEADKLS